MRDRDKEFAAILADQADDLNRGQDVAARYVTQHQDDRAELQTLLDLAKSVKAVLTPVRATTFKESLRQRLIVSPEQGRSLRRVVSSTNFVWISVAAAGSLLSVVGLVVLVLRKIKTSTKVDSRAAAAAAG